ncbi:MAG TPA: DinB family protein [Bryobacteraceae bacterium]|nr:DinB family protein [Bryobacteraceae bacterium]
MVRVEYVLNSWKTVRQDTIQAVEDCPAGELDFKPAPELMSFREIARHILDAGSGLSGMLLDGETNLAAPDFREKMKRHFSALPAGAAAASLAAALREALDRRLPELAARPPEFFSQIITRFDGQQVTRLEMLQMIKEHELTHRQQLFMYLRLKGIVPVTTRRRMAASAPR